MNVKRKGNRNEGRSVAILENAGYRRSRNAASLGELHVIGIGPPDVALIPVKTRYWPGSVAMERLKFVSGTGELP